MIEKILRIILILTVMLLSFALGVKMAMNVAKADEPYKIGIYKTVDGKQLVEICYDEEEEDCERIVVADINKYLKELNNE